MYWKTNVNGSNPQNGSGYSNPAYDALSDQLACEFDPAKRRDIIIQMERFCRIPPPPSSSVIRRPI